MKLGFWNINNSDYDDIKTYVTEFISKYDLDILFLSEYERIDLDTFKDELYQMKYKIECNLTCKKVLMVKKECCDFVIPTDDRRYIVTQSMDLNLTLVGVHLEDRFSSRSDLIRYDSITRICESLNELKQNKKYIILIGDFNCLPTDEILLNKQLLWCIPFKEEVKKVENDNVFYNPTLLALNEKNQMYGSIRYNASITMLWYPFDQVLISKTLIDKKYSFEYIKEIAGESLVSKNDVPKKKVSDHLPIYFEIDV